MGIQEKLNAVRELLSYSDITIERQLDDWFDNIKFEVTEMLREIACDISGGEFKRIETIG